MPKFLTLFAFLVLPAALTTGCWKEVKVVPADSAAVQAAPILDHKVKTLSGEETSLAAYRGKVMLVVNTASACGLTPQYQGLQELWEKYRDRGLVVLGFPCNDFAGQEPGTAEEIKSFCTAKFNVTFPLFEKVRAKGDKSPLYKTLTEEVDPALRGEIQWNFTKFLADREGRVVARFEPRVTPDDPKLIAEIERLLGP
ncbi:MAG: glutathione peroxidase [Myxococcota bacterium]|jgi:glutathione peroxidase